MSKKESPNNEDPTSVSRKQDHIQLAEASEVGQAAIDPRFYYEPILSGHPDASSDISKTFLNKQMKHPIWVSSMTGGTELARTINHNLAKACKEFGLGMGLGSCRKLMYDNSYLSDFAVRDMIGDQPLYANLGIAQLEQIAADGNWQLIIDLLDRLSADGLIIHVNPLQEWLQPEGDRYHIAPLDTIRRAIDALDTSIIVKEVGQGMGKESLRALLSLPIDGIEFAAAGGTNFAKLELLRSTDLMMQTYSKLALVGHTAEDMMEMTNSILDDHKGDTPDLIISGGVKDFLDGYYLIDKCKANAVYGQASSFLQHAMGSYEDLQKYVHAQVEGLKIAHSLLKAR